MLGLDVSAEATGLSFAFHHVGYLVKDRATSAQDLVERLGYCIESDVIEDPVQTAFVQFLRQPGVTSWLELVMPNGRKSKLTNALHKGGGLHHLCYEVSDIEVACRYLRDRAMFMLSAPVMAMAFPGRRIAWFIDRSGFLVELLEQGDGALSLASLDRIKRG